MEEGREGGEGMEEIRKIDKAEEYEMLCSKLHLLPFYSEAPQPVMVTIETPTVLPKYRHLGVLPFWGWRGHWRKLKISKTLLEEP